MFALDHSSFVSAHHNSKLTNGTQLPDTDMEHSQRIVLEEPAEMMAQKAPAHHHQDKNVLYECHQCASRSSSGTDKASDATMGGVSLNPLAKNCAVGIPVSASLAAIQLPEGNNMLTVAMNFVQNDDYHGILELARAGAVNAMAPERRCGFALALKPEGCAMSDLPLNLRVSDANLLHYAVCIGSFRAAAALLIVNPALAQGTCLVVTGHDTDTDTSHVHTEEWCAAELARLFCVLYQGDNDDNEVEETKFRFEQALTVLEMCDACPEKLPFVNLPTVQERVVAAGWDAEAAVQAFFASASISGYFPDSIE